MLQLGDERRDVDADGVADLAGGGQRQLLGVHLGAREPLALDLDVGFSSSHLAMKPSYQSPGWPGVPCVQSWSRISVRGPPAAGLAAGAVVAAGAAAGLVGSAGLAAAVGAPAGAVVAAGAAGAVVAAGFGASVGLAGAAVGRGRAAAGGQQPDAGRADEAG